MIVCCGEALIDIIHNEGHTQSVPGGGPMNAAIAAARLGAPSAFVGRVSYDEPGQLIWRHLQRNKVTLSTCERGPEPTAQAIVSHEPRVSFRFVGEGTADTALKKADLSSLGDGPHILHGGTLGMFRGRTAEVLASVAQHHQGIVSVDPNVRPAVITDRDRWNWFHQRWIAAADLYRASDEDLEWIWPGRATDACAAELLAGRTTAVCATRGEDGVTVYTAEGQLDIAAPPVEVVDTVGAGDTFVGAVLVSLWELVGASRAAFAAIELQHWRHIAERGLAAAAITCARAGADPPYAHEMPTTTQHSGG